MNSKMLLAILLVLLAFAASAIAAGADPKPEGPASPAKTRVSGPGPSGVKSPSAPMMAAGTGFTYQGRLTDGGSPANGQYDLQFTLFDDPSAGNQVGTSITLTNQTVTGGLFTVALDFGSSAFQGDARYLEIAVRPAGNGNYTTLSPRQPLAPAPYAISLVPGATVSGTLGSTLLTVNNSGGTGITSSSTGDGVQGATSNGGATGVWGNNTGGGKGVFGTSTSGHGVEGGSTSGAGVYGTGATEGVVGVSTTGYGVYAFSNTGLGLYASSSSNSGVYGNSSSGTGVRGNSQSGDGVLGVTSSTIGSNIAAVYGSNTGGGAGVQGASASGWGVYGTGQTGVRGFNNTNGVGVVGDSLSGSGMQALTYNGFAAIYDNNSGTGYGVDSYSNGGVAIYGNTTGNIAVEGVTSTTAGSNLAAVYGNNSNGGPGVQGNSSGGDGVSGTSTSNYGVYGSSNSSSVAGVYGTNPSTGPGVQGQGIGGNGVNAFASAAGVSGIFAENEAASGYGIYAKNRNGYAGYFEGNLHVTGTCCSMSEATTQIDDPLDPANKYLNEYTVESPDLKNMVDGVAVLDGNGEAAVQLPAWFGASNGDFRYQLTCIGGYAQVYIAREVQNNTFEIAGGKPSMKVSWQVTGTRQDPYANAHRAPAEQEKPANDKGYYLHPELYGQPQSKSIDPSIRNPLPGQSPTTPAGGK